MSHLDYYIHDELEALRFEIRDPLAGHGVTSLDQAWRTGSSILNGRLLLIDLVKVHEVGIHISHDGRQRRSRRIRKCRASCAAHRAHGILCTRRSTR
jgi:hypothetical protein